MRHFIRLIEGPSEDMSALQLADAAETAFRDFARRHEDRPLTQWPRIYRWPTQFKQVTAYPPSIWAVPATAMGLPYDDLHIGVLTETKEDRGGLQVLRDEGRTVYVLGIAATAELNVSETTDVPWMLAWDSFSHEFIHYLDKKRGVHRHDRNKLIQRAIGKAPPRVDPQEDPAAYINDPQEFNAHYQQAINRVMKDVFTSIIRPSRASTVAYALASFENFERSVRVYGLKDWVAVLNPLYRRKYLRRLARLYRDVKTTYPDVPSLRTKVSAHLAQIAANEASWGSPD